MKLNELVHLKRASTYQNPGDPGAIIPRAYGDFSSPGAGGSALDVGGIIPATLIDILTWTYALNDGASGEVTTVYVEDVPQSPAVYSVNLVDNYEGHGTITTVTFNTDPGGRAVSWRGKGLLDDGGVLITNPIEALRHHFMHAGEPPWDRDYFDPTTITEAEVLAETRGLPIHWVFAEDKTYRELLTDVFVHYFADFIATYQGNIAVLLDEPTVVDPDRILGHIDVAAHVAGEWPEASVVWETDSANLCNELTIAYQYSWSRQTYTASTTVTDQRSIALYKGKRTRQISLPGVRTQSHLDAWVAQFFNRYALLPATISLPLRTMRAIGQLPSTYSTVSWRYGPEVDGRGWSHRLVKVLSHTLQFSAHQIAIHGFDSGLDWRAQTYLVLTNALAQTWYLSATVEGTWQLGQTNPGADALDEGVVWAWIRLTSPNATNYWLRPLSATSWTITTSQPAGTGTTNPVILTSRNGQIWRLAITDAQEVILLVEPRRLPFGGFEWQTSTFGQGRFDYHVFA